MCLVTGAVAPVRRLHPSIRGVEGAQSSGASLVSFNLEAFRSYGKEQGDNAPTSEAAAFRYGAALNRMLDRGSRNRIQRTVGDTTVVFWADASGVGETAAKLLRTSLQRSSIRPPRNRPAINDAQEAAKLRDRLEDSPRAGRSKRPTHVLTLAPAFYVLGLAPNAARLSVRFWLEDDFEHVAHRMGLARAGPRNRAAASAGCAPAFGSAPARQDGRLAGEIRQHPAATRRRRLRARF